MQSAPSVLSTAPVAAAAAAALPRGRSSIALSAALPRFSWARVLGANPVSPDRATSSSSPSASSSRSPLPSPSPERARPLIPLRRRYSVPNSGVVAMSSTSGTSTADADVVLTSSSDILPGVIVGAGRVGSALEAMGGGRDVVVRRGQTIPPDSTGPILVCTRNDALDAVVDQTPENRRPDLVFFQNGMLDPWLQSRSLQDATQVLVYFAVARLGDKPIDGITDLNPEGLTAASGKWAEAVAARLHSAGLSCKVLSKEQFEKPKLEKLIWISAFMLVGVRQGKVSVGDVESKFTQEVDELVEELAGAATWYQREVLGKPEFAFDAGLTERLRAYARSVAHYPTALKEVEWRNGWFTKVSEEAVKRGRTDPCPLHAAWLKAVLG